MTKHDCFQAETIGGHKSELKNLKENDTTLFSLIEKISDTGYGTMYRNGAKPSSNPIGTNTNGSGSGCTLNWAEGV